MREAYFNSQDRVLQRGRVRQIANRRPPSPCAINTATLIPRYVELTLREICSGQAISLYGRVTVLLRSVLGVPNHKDCRMDRIIALALAFPIATLTASTPLLAQIAPMPKNANKPPATVHYEFSMSKPPLLSAYKGSIYDVPSEELVRIAGTAEYDEHTSVPTANGKFQNTDKHVSLVHRYYWTLTSVPVRYATDITYKIKNTTGYTKTDFESTEKTLGASAGAKVFGIGIKAQASLKLTQTETQQWHEERSIESDQTFKSHYIYCTWTLVDNLETTVDTKTSEDAADQPSSSPPTRTEASFRYAALIYQDDAPDPGATVLSNAIKSFSLAGKTSLGAPLQMK